MCHVSLATHSASKNVKFRISWNLTKFDWVSRDDSNNEFCFVIRDVEKFQVFRSKLLFYPFLKHWIFPWFYNNDNVVCVLRDFFFHIRKR